VVHAGSSWTDLVIEEGDSLLSIDGLLTGWHEPRSTHLDLLAAVAGRGLLDVAYQSALEERYLWHEFGDSLLILRSAHAAGEGRRIGL
jgi:S-adenosylmethionine:tRNA ribosyltransferase-isomerase